MRVLVRVRPFHEREAARSARLIVDVDEADNVSITNPQTGARQASLKLRSA